MSSKNKIGIPDTLKMLVRSVILSAPKASVDLGKFESEFRRQVHVPFLYKKYGFSSTLEMLEFMSDTVKLTPSGVSTGGCFLTTIIPPDLNLPPFLAKLVTRDRIMEKSNRSTSLRENGNVRNSGACNNRNDSLMRKSNTGSGSRDLRRNDDVHNPAAKNNSNLSNSGNSKQSHEDEGTLLFVGNLPLEFSESDLSDIFKDYNFYNMRQIVRDRKHYAFLNMHSVKDVQHAIRELNGLKICGHTLTVAPANKSNKTDNPEKLSANKATNMSSYRKAPPALEPLPSTIHKSATRNPPPLERLERNVQNQPPSEKTFRKALRRPMEISHAQSSNSVNRFEPGSIQPPSHTNRQYNLDCDISQHSFRNRTERPTGHYDCNQIEEFTARDTNGYNRGRRCGDVKRNEYPRDFDFNRTSKRNDNLFEVCIANFPYFVTKDELRDLVLDYEPMKIVMGNNKQLPPPNDITYAYIYFLNEFNAQECVEVLDNFIFEDNVLYAFIDDEDDYCDEEYRNHICELVAKLDLSSRSNPSSNEVYEHDEYFKDKTSKFYPDGKPRSNDGYPDDRRLLSKSYHHGRNEPTGDLVSELYPNDNPRSHNAYYDYRRPASKSYDHGRRRNNEEQDYNLASKLYPNGKPRHLTEYFDDGKNERLLVTKHYSP